MFIHNVDVLIIGAGLSGLMAARELQKTGLAVALVEAGPCVGGRLATRQIGLGRADHGAQYFTVRTPEFRSYVDTWLQEGLVYSWALGWSMGSLASNTTQGHPRYAARDGMSHLATHLATDLDVYAKRRAVTISLAEGAWHTTSEDGATYQSQSVLLTPPAPQSLALLDAGGVSLQRDDRAVLERLRYSPCLAGMFHVEGTVRIPPPGAVQRPAHPIRWIADNRQKGISPDATIITIHAGPEYSRRLWAATDWELVETMRANLDPYLGRDAEIVEAQFQRWRYSQPEVTHSNRCFVAQDMPHLVFAGDVFGDGRVEGAALSGLAAGRTISELLGRS